MARSLRRLAAVVLPALVLPAAALGAGSMQSWAQPQIKLVTEQGIFTGTPATFDGSAPLTEGALASAIARLTGTPAATAPDPSAPVSMEDLDRSLVGALGLADSAYRFRIAVRAAGITPPQRFGGEVVARLLGLRLNHPAGQDDLELDPEQAATRAEAAYSFARILRFGAGNPADAWRGDGTASSSSATDESPLTDYATSGPVEQAKELSQSFALPPLTTWQRRILTTAFSYVGYPYVWGGTGDGTAGYDCSGFVWRVYKLTAYPDEGDLASVLRGRTTMQMSGEVPRSLRIAIDELEPGDVLFFGRGPHSKPKQVDHAAIYIGNGWLVQSSGDGVTLAPFDGWYRSSFAWARRPLAEAGLA
jgi:cell wall-associated NlpC family hydrolase